MHKCATVGPILFAHQPLKYAPTYPNPIASSKPLGLVFESFPNQGRQNWWVSLFLVYFQSRKRFYNHKCPFVHPSVISQNPLTAWNHHSSFILHHSSFILSSFHDFSACFILCYFCPAARQKR